MSTKRKPRSRGPRARTSAPWVAVSCAAAEALYAHIRGLGTAELRALARTARRANEENCWWLVYDLREVLTELAESHIRIREIPRPARSGRRGK